jgi:hypothetical protein
MRIVVLLAALLTSVPATAQSPSRSPAMQLDPALQAEVDHIRTWTQDAAILKAVREQNALNVPLSRIRSIDISWMTSKEPDPRMQALLKNPCSKSLQGFTKARAEYREAFVMENQGALVCMTRKTSDYWQGDEDKWRKSFAEGRGAVFVSEPQLDESTGARLVHVSVPILDGGKAIGVISVGIDHDLLRRRKR